MGSSQLPSLRLPPLRGLATLSPAVLSDCIEYLRVLYTPRVRGSRIRRRFIQNSDAETPVPSPALNVPAVDQDLDDLTADEFERAYTLRWLTYVINNSERLQGTPSEVDAILHDASALLANCGGAASAGVISRVLDFPAARGPISIALRDIALENGDIASVGAQTWGGACVLAEIIAAQPADFGLIAGRPTRLRVLELGAGTGLAGLALAKAAESVDLDVSVVCTDFYPSVLENLATNIVANFPDPDRCVSSHFLDWASFVKDNDTDPLPPPLDEPFDVILGADIIYEPEHAAWIHACVSRMLARSEASQFHLVIPLRPTHAFESNSVETFFGKIGSPTDSGLTIRAKETIVCGVEGSPAEEVEYVYYRIGWASSL
ncbi:putative methyltransferase-domain-containing protein [Mycena polygramma]|nr:putative methyltransferase-domain-containing protein [Mycena polygramma]